MLTSNSVIYLAIGLSFLAPIAVAWRGGSFRRIFFATWISFILFCVFVDLVVPIIAKALEEQGTYRQPDVPPTWMGVFGGWIYGLVFGGVVLAIRHFRKLK